MTPQQIIQELNILKSRLSQVEKVETVSFIENMIRRIGGVGPTVETGASTTGTTISVRNSTDDGSETVADDYDGVLTLTDTQGNSYRIGYYT